MIVTKKSPIVANPVHDNAAVRNSLPWTRATWTQTAQLRTLLSIRLPQSHRSTDEMDAESPRADVPVQCCAAHHEKCSRPSRSGHRKPESGHSWSMKRSRP